MTMGDITSTRGGEAAIRSAIGLRQVMSIAAFTAQRQEHNRSHERAKRADAY